MFYVIVSKTMLTRKIHSLNSTKTTTYLHRLAEKTSLSHNNVKKIQTREFNSNTSPMTKQAYKDQSTADNTLIPDHFPYLSSLPGAEQELSQSNGNWSQLLNVPIYNNYYDINKRISLHDLNHTVKSFPPCKTEKK